MNLLTDLNETSLSIPSDLADKIKKRSDDKGFKSLSDYVTYILRQVLSKIEVDEKQKSGSSVHSEEDVKQKLRDMGYLD